MCMLRTASSELKPAYRDRVRDDGQPHREVSASPCAPDQADEKKQEQKQAGHSDADEQLEERILDDDRVEEASGLPRGSGPGAEPVAVLAGVDRDGDRAFANARRQLRLDRRRSFDERAEVERQDAPSPQKTRKASHRPMFRQPRKNGATTTATPAATAQRDDRAARHRREDTPGSEGAAHQHPPTPRREPRADPDHGGHGEERGREQRVAERPLRAVDREAELARAREPVHTPATSRAASRR